LGVDQIVVEEYPTIRELSRRISINERFAGTSGRHQQLASSPWHAVAQLVEEILEKDYVVLRGPGGDTGS
jgi:hypothetical protein